jgi:hypothetical protein
MLIRDNKFDEFTLPVTISKINITHALSRLLSLETNQHPRMEEDRTCQSTPNHAMHTLQISSAHTQFYRCVFHRKAATHNWRIQVSGAKEKRKWS